MYNGDLITSSLYYSTIILPHHCITSSLYYPTIILLHHYITPPLYHFIIIFTPPLYHFIIILLHYYITPLLYYSTIISLHCYITSHLFGIKYLPERTWRLWVAVDWKMFFDQCCSCGNNLWPWKLMGICIFGRIVISRYDNVGSYY